MQLTPPHWIRRTAARLYTATSCSRISTETLYLKLRQTFNSLIIMGPGHIYSQRQCTILKQTILLLLQKFSFPRQINDTEEVGDLRPIKVHSFFPPLSLLLLKMGKKHACFCSLDDHIKMLPTQSHQKRTYFQI